METEGTNEGTRSAEDGAGAQQSSAPAAESAAGPERKAPIGNEGSDEKRETPVARTPGPSAPRARASTPATDASGATQGDGSDGAARSSEGSDGDGAASEGGAPGGATSEIGPDGAPKRRRRGRRGGKRHRRKPAGAGGASPGGDGDESDDGDESEDGVPASSDGAAPAAASTEGDGTAGAAPRQRPPRQRAPRTQQPRTAAATARVGADETPTAAAPEGTGLPQPGGARELGSATAAEAAQAVGGDDAGDDDGTGAEGGAGPRKRRRRRRGGAKKTGEGAATQGESGATAPQAGAGERPKQQQQQKQQPKEAASASGGGSTRLAARKMRKGQQSAGNRRPRKRLTEEEARQLRGAEKTMLIHEHEERTQIAVLEEGLLIEHFVARRGHKTSMAGSVFLGKVQNVLPGMEAAFVDFGRGRNGVLYAGEVNYSAEDLEGDAPRIEKVLRSGQALMVQVTKDPIGSKGARLTAQISLAGRFMVLAPDQPVTGISRRLAENERARLRQILREIRPNGHGVIIRTAAEGATKDALERDLQNLLKIWDNVQKAAKKAKAPATLYSEPELVMRVVRDIFSGDFGKVIVDSRAVHTEITDYVQETAPDLLDKIELYQGALPLFEEFRVTEQLHKALERKVWLPSGGSLVIDRTEAMTVIDVNTGKFTGKGSNLEETVFLNNLEAAEEIARQLRLRDIGGIIVVDFIDMIDPKNQQELLRTLKRALARDKTRSQVFEVSHLGLVEMTRKKVSEGLLDAFSEPCPNCDGRGIVITHKID